MAMFSGTNVPINALDAFIANKAQISAEYKELHSQGTAYMNSGKHIITSAQLPVNVGLNRYQNVLPFEPTRFKLATTPEYPSDYINANVINSLVPRSTPAYIGTQGPLPETETAFWRMVWDSGATVIVMLTRLIENGMVKCHHYWPTKATEHKKKYGPIEVEIASVAELEKSGVKDGLVLRKAVLRCGSETRQVYHFQLIAWPDAGVPTTTTEVLHLMDAVNAVRSRHHPIIVHCSAGIGRTGTFVLVHSILHNVERDLRKRPHKMPTVNLFEALSKLRTQKPMMVQTEEQYEFCYRVIADGVKRILDKKNEKKHTNAL